jgi:serine/threonine protein kinase
MESTYIGKQIGNYRVVSEIGSGSFGVVYRAEHIFLPNRVGAIKLLHAAHLDSWEDRESFLLEARMLEVLKHPYILPILDVGIHEGFPYLVTEYAPRGSLRGRLQQIYPWLLSTEESIQILSQVGEALHHAHEQNIIHRDLKPANILFNEKGDALLADFGIATTLATASIRFVEISGSPPYMAPEQFQGAVSKESDQYSLGCIAYQLFTGRRPFVASDPSTMGFKHLIETPIPPSKLNLQIPPQIDQAVLKAMAKERNDRFTDIAAFIAALQATPIYQVQSFPMSTGENAPALLSTRASDSDQAQLVPVPASGLLLEDEDTAKRIPMMDTNPSQSALNQAPPAPLPPQAANMPNQEEMPTLPEVSAAAPKQNAVVTAPLPLPIITDKPEKNGTGSRSKTKRRKRVPAIILTALVLLLVAASVFYAVVSIDARSPLTPFTFMQPKPTATVTLTPLSKDVKNTYTIAIVTGKPDASHKEVSGARIISHSALQSRQVNATGEGTTPATRATGTMTFSDATENIKIPAGEYLVDANGISLVIKSSVKLQANGPAVTVAAYTRPAGAKGNVPANDINGNFCYPDCTDGSAVFHVQNTVAFTGGRDLQNYAFVEQSDINNAAGQLEGALARTARAAIKSKIKPSEQMTGSISCRSSVSSNHEAGARVPDVTVSVTETCSVEVYDSQAAQDLAAKLLKDDLTTLLGAGYVIPGNVTTQVSSLPKVTKASHGTLSVNITAHGTALYQFTRAEEQAFAKLIAGKMIDDAHALLLTQSGVAQAAIKISGNRANKLPAEAGQITFVVASSQ